MRWNIFRRRHRTTSQDVVNQTISDLRPHFLCNALSSISHLCRHSPEEASVMADNLAEFLNWNMRCMTNPGPILFRKEAEYLKKYIDLEKMRFTDMLEVTYDLRELDFLIPCRVLLPLLENTIRIRRQTGEDICRIRIETRCTGEHFLVEIETNEKSEEVVSEEMMERVRSMKGAALTSRQKKEGILWVLKVPDTGM